MLQQQQQLSYSQVRSFLLDLAERIMQSKDELNRMDSNCGDGDFGTSMFIAFSSVRETIETVPEEDVGKLLTRVGRSILSAAGGTAGPLFGTLFLEAGEITKGKTGLDLNDLMAMLQAGMQKMRARGGATVGDKTLIDALEPAVESLREGAETRADLSDALQDAYRVALRGFESTKHMIAKHGKARYLGNQTLGYADPGAFVISTIFETLATLRRRKREGHDISK